MNNIREILASKAPSAEFSESEPLTVTVPASELRAAALELRNDPRMQFDFLVSLTGMDWGDTLGVVYHLRSTASGSEIVLKTSTAEKENPELPTVSDIWKTANLNEREAYDFFGIRFVGHPDMRRLYLRSDWVGFPLRKDYDASPEINPIRLESEPMTDSRHQAHTLPSTAMSTNRPTTMERLGTTEKIRLDLITLLSSLRVMPSSRQWS